MENKFDADKLAQTLWLKTKLQFVYDWEMEFEDQTIIVSAVAALLRKVREEALEEAASYACRFSGNLRYALREGIRALKDKV